MAWVRTSLSLTSFGFTVYKILEGFQSAGRVLGPGNTPRTTGLFLTGLGTLAMIMGTVEYWQTLKALKVKPRRRVARPAMIMAVIMSVTGIGLFVDIYLGIF